MIQLTDLSFAYKRRQKLFDHLQLNLTGGNIYGLLGKNGAGKTTLLKIICGLLFPHGGSSTVLGIESRRRSPEMLRELFLLPEEFHVPPVSAEAFRRYYAPFYPRFSLEMLETYLGEFGIRQSDRLAALSYGNRKKFLLAFGLATKCRLLILDEPTNGLDIPSKSQFRRLVAGALTDERIFIISTHQVRDMENLIDPIVIIDAGKIVFHQSTEAITKKLSIRTVDHPADIENALYSEKSLGGYTVVTPNKNGGESHIDLELLFNTVSAAGPRIETLFAQGESR
jgi:ABC-2 type transport system ATP-binding protein